MPGRVVSRYTLMIFGIAMAVVAIAFALVSLRVGGDMGVKAASDFGELFVVGLAATAILRSASKLGPTSPIGRTWLLIGLGAACYAVGDGIWAIMEVGLRQEVPYPGLPDLFYLLEYPFFAAGIISAGQAFKNLVITKQPWRVAAVVGVVLTGVVYFGLLRPSVFVDGVGLPEQILSALYPLGDVWLMIVPASFVLAAVFSLGGGRLAWPWWWVAGGSVVIAVSDCMYSWLSAADLYASGHFVDYGWSIGHALVMLGALIARDMAAPRS